VNEKGNLIFKLLPTSAALGGAVLNIKSLHVIHIDQVTNIMSSIKKGLEIESLRLDNVS
jgi:hypothetical protein